MELFTNNIFFGIFISLFAFEIGSYIYRKTNTPLLNPILISLILIISFLEFFHISFYTYNIGAKYITMFLGPATVILAVPLYKQIDLLRKHASIIVIGITIGSIVGIISVIVLCKIFGLSDLLIKSLIPKSVTTPIGIEVSKQLGGVVPLTTVAIVITGIFGAVAGPSICKWLKIDNKIAIGLAMGTSSHALGTYKALELGETEGATSSLAIGIAGIVTVFIAAPIYYLMIYLIG